MLINISTKIAKAITGIQSGETYNMSDLFELIRVSDEIYRILCASLMIGCFAIAAILTVYWIKEFRKVHCLSKEKES